MNITFYGAAQTVTGSCTLLECAGTRLLVDCGLPQGADEKKLGTDFQFNPEQIDFILLTHAHIDHSGRIPMMVREGVPWCCALHQCYRGPLLHHAC